MKNFILINTEEYLSSSLEKELVEFVKSKFEYTKDFQHKVQIVKSSDNTSMVDCIIDIFGNDGNIKDGLLIEITQSTDSRNAISYQRISKFVFLSALDKYTSYTKVMWFTTDFTPTTDTHRVGLSLMDYIGLEFYNLKEFTPSSLVEAEKIKNNCVKKAETDIPIKFYINHDLKRISVECKLFKSGSLSHDPNIGFLSALIFIANKMNYEIFVSSHCLTEKIIKSYKGKLYKICALLNKKINFKIDDKTITWYNYTYNANDDYHKNLEDGEKLSMINFCRDMEEKGLKFIFRNIAGCEREKISSDGNLISVPKKIKIPDLALLKNGNLVLIEGECSKNINKGIQQLETFGDFVEFMKKHFVFDKVEKYVITDLECNSNNENYIGWYLTKEKNNLNYEFSI